MFRGFHVPVMNKKLFLAVRFLMHFIRSGSKFDIHSPFVYQVYSEIIKDPAEYPQYKTIENFRKRLLKKHGYIAKSDLGARGSATPWAKQFVHIRKIVRTSSVTPRYGQLLFRFSRYFKPGNILEMGTSFGISAAYLAMGNLKGNVVTIEGCPNTAGSANQNFDEWGIRNVRLVIGNFDSILPGLLPGIGPLDMVFFDGNHRKEATLNYFSQCMQHRASDAVFIFDDIHWSREMEEAWIEIKKHPSVRITIDLFQMGLVFFREGLSKEDFILRF